MNGVTSGMQPSTVDLTTPPNEMVDTPPEEPTFSLGAISSSLDATASLPDFLNSVLPYSLPENTRRPDAKTPLPEPDLEALDRTLHDLLTRLSILSQDTSSALEQSINDISRTVPRLTYDLQFMRESAATLHTSLGVVQSRMTRTTGSAGKSSSEHEGEHAATGSDAAKTFKSLEKIAHLDKLKTRMESARDVLREAESWSTLEGEITAFIASSAWEKAGGRLSEASKSLVVFQSTPSEYESRKGLLVSLQNELETALASALKSALDKDEVQMDEVARFAKVFRMMERGAEFKDYYFAARRQPVLDEWAKFEGKAFATFLPQFFAVLLTAVSSESDKVGRFFNESDPSDTLGDLLTTTMDALSPSLGSRLSTMADALGALALPELIKAYKATEELESAVCAILEKTRGAASSPNTPSLEIPTPSPGLPTSPVGRPSPIKRSSAAPSFKQSSTTTTTLLSSAPSAWTTSLFEPFLDLQTSYATLERRLLTHQLRNDPILSSYRSGKNAQALSERANTAFALASEALGRNESFTHGFGCKGMVDAVGSFLASFFDAQSDVIEPSKSASIARSDADELDFGGIDYSTEDWAAFQSGLRTLKTCRDVGGKLAAFEAKVYEALMEAAVSSSTTLSDSIILLQQSPLNSAELQALLASVQGGSSSSSTTRQLYRHALEPARSSLADLTRLSQTSLQRIILSPLMSLLNTYPSLSAWAQPDKAARRDGLVVPTFSLSPTDTIARITEGLLNLLRVFEGVGEDEALGFSLETLPFVDADTLRDMAAAAAGESTDLLDEGDISPTASATAATSSATTTTTTKSSSDEIVLPPALVLSTWISSLSLTLLSHLTRTTLPSFKTLSNHGASQLAVDLGYLSNAVRALDVEWEDLERWRQGAELSKEEEWREALKTASDLQSESTSSTATDILKRIGRLRGWPSAA